MHHAVNRVETMKHTGHTHCSYHFICVFYHYSGRKYDFRFGSKHYLLVHLITRKYTATNQN